MTLPNGASGEKGEASASFEEALTRLEQIVQELEGKDLSLEETLARYEEGSKLVEQCRRRLDAAEQRIRTLSGSPEDVEETGGKTEEGESAHDLPF